MNEAPFSRSKRLLWAAGVGLALVPALSAQVPPLISYQGRVTAAGAPLDGTGQFKFALVSSNGAATLWSNDGTSSSGAEPLKAAVIPVHQGLFSVLLGDGAVTNMQPILWPVFTNAGVRLRIWFSDGTNAFQLLAPDQRLSAVGYAMMAANLPDGAVTSNKLAPGAVTGLQLAPNSVSAQALADGAVTAGKLAPQSVTAAALADHAVGQAKLDFQLSDRNVRNPPYLARGDGVSDDTAAIQSALNDAGASGGGVVFLPRGNYLVARQLSVPAQTTLAGVWRAPTAGSQYRGTTLLAVANAGNTSGIPFITLAGPNSTLDGVTVYYPNQVVSNAPTAYPWTVRAGGGENVTIQNVLLVNPYLGVDFATRPSARHLIRGLYGQPLLVGIAVDQCYDIGRILDVHFWPFWSQDTNVWAFQLNQGVSFDFMRTDWEVVQDIFSWGYHIGARFRASASGAMNGQMSNVNFDNVDIGLEVSATQPYAVHISNLNLANAGGGNNHIGIRAPPGGSSYLNVNGASFWGLIRQPVLWWCDGLFTLSNARVLAWDSSRPAINILAGRAMIQANYFTDHVGTAIHVGPGTDRVMIIGNELARNTLSLEGPLTLSADNHP